MKWSKKDVEDAAIECSALACDRMGDEVMQCPCGESLSWRAFLHASPHIDDPGRPVQYDCAIVWAEAESLLRTGWTPLRSSLSTSSRDSRRRSSGSRRARARAG